MKTFISVAFVLLFSNLIHSQIIVGFENDNIEPDSLSSLTISGFVDSYYTYNTNNPGLKGNWGTTGLGRLLDGEHNQIAFNMLQTKFEYTNKNLSVVGDIAFGPGAEAFNYGNVGTARIIKQAYAAYTLKKMTFTVGQFSTHIGYEMIDVPDNSNYGVSYLFAYGPYYHTGAKLDYEISNKIGLMLGVFNGWDSMKDNNKFKTMAAQLSIAPSDNFEVYLNWIGGNEEPFSSTGDTVQSFKQLFDLSLSTNLTEKFCIGLNSSFGIYNYEGQTQKNWGGAALYLNYAFSDQNVLAVRAELFDDSNGVQGLSSSYTGYTLTFNKYLANNHLIVKPEIRYDQSSQNIYFKNDNTLSKSQLTFGMAVVAKF